MFGHLRLPPRCGIAAQHRCGLCGHFGRTYRRRTRLLAGDDATAAALLCEGLAAEPAPRVDLACPLPPFRRRRSVDPDWPPLRPLAAAQLLLWDEKLADDRLDRDSPLAAVARLLLRPDLARGAEELARLGLDVAAVRSALGAQAALERDPAADLDQLSAPTAAGLAALLGFCARAAGCGAEIEVARFADRLGRALYLVDALCDLRRDTRRRAFNPLPAALGHLGPAALRYLAGALEGRMAALRAALDALPLRRHRELLREVAVAGLADRGRRALAALASGPGRALSVVAA